MRLVKSTELRQGGGQHKMRLRIIAIGFNRPSTPGVCLLIIAEANFCDARVTHPEVSHRVARTEAQRLGYVGLRLLGVAHKHPAVSDKGMSAG